MYPSLPIVPVALHTIFATRYPTMNGRTKTVLNWSSGKDAAMAYHLLQQQEAYEVTHLLTTISQDHNRVVMHGTSEQLLELQAHSMKVPLVKVLLPSNPDHTVYEQTMQRELAALQQQGVNTAAFGDIYLEDLRSYREQQLARIGMQAVFPLWQRDTRERVRALEQAGIAAMIVCVDCRKLGKEWLGRTITAELMATLPAGVDPCGENGEFHTFVYQAPFFAQPIAVQVGETVYKTYPSPDGDSSKDAGFYFLDITGSLV